MRKPRSTPGLSQHPLWALLGLDKGENAQELFWTILKTGKGDLVAFLTRSVKVDLNAIPAGAQVPPIVQAASKGQGAVASALLHAGANVDASNPRNGITALMAAANAGQSVVVEMLIEAGASIDSPDDFGFTSLMFAAEGGRLKCAKILLKHHADPSPKSHDGRTALDYAIQHGNRDIAPAIENAMKAPRLFP